MKACLAVLLLCSFAGAADVQYIEPAHIPLYGTQIDEPNQNYFCSFCTDETVVITERVEVSGDETCMDVLVMPGGTLVLQPGHSLKCRTLTNYGGTIERWGHGEIVTRDLPIDHALDPMEWGHGTLVIRGGLICRSTEYRQESGVPLAEPLAGDTQALFGTLPVGWQVGDTLVFPDTRQHETAEEFNSLQIEEVSITKIYKDKVTFAPPLQWDHKGYRDSAGVVQRVADVANIVQPLVWRSENPAGVRGHVAIIGAGWCQAVGIASYDMGRTRAADAIDSSFKLPDGTWHIGTNNIARYAWHWHHCYGPEDSPFFWQSNVQHWSFCRSPKWGCSIHNSFAVNLSEGTAYDNAGCGIVTEEVNSSLFRIHDNVVIAKSVGSGLRITTNHGGRGLRNDPKGDFWTDRGGLGLSSAMGEITDNRLYDCKESIGMAGFGTSVLFTPIKLGVPTMDKNSPNANVLDSFNGNVPGEPRRYPFIADTSGNTAWGGWRGIETWTADCYPGMEKMFPGYTLIHCHYPTNFEDQEETALSGWRFLGDPAYANAPTDNGVNNTFAIDFKPAYRFGITVDDCEVRGYDAAFDSDTDKDYVRFNRCTFEVPTVIYQPNGSARENRGCEYTLDDCAFVGNPLFADGWYPKLDLSSWLKVDRPANAGLLPVKYLVRPWSDGHDYQVFHYEQLPTWQHAKGPPPAGKAYGDLPVGLWTQQQLIGVGTPIFGEIVPADAVQWGRFYAKDISPQ